MEDISVISLDNSQTEEESMLVDDSSSKSSELDNSKSSAGKDMSDTSTPKKQMNSKQLQKKLESEKKKQEKQKEREEKEKEKLRLKEEKEKMKQEKDEQKLKEKLEKQKEREMKEEQKKKEKEEKEMRRKEKEEKEEQKRKEKEQEKLKRQMEIDEKNKEKQKAVEQKQKAAAVFANFFVPKKTSIDNVSSDDKKQDASSTFMPFEVKSDMRLAPLCRRFLSDEAKEALTKILEVQSKTKSSYLNEIKNSKTLGKSENTWPYEEQDDVVIIEETDADLGQSILEQKPEARKMRVKFLHFRENRRPPYYGTWRKTSKSVKPRCPLAQDKEYFNYEIDSDDEWEEEDPGESIRGSDDEDKENDSGNEYEEDNEFFVPHGHLSEDELDDEENATFSPESHKVKLKLLKSEFDEEMKLKTQKIKPRLIGCIWYDKNDSIEDEAIHRYLKPFSILHNENIVIKTRNELSIEHKNRNIKIMLDKEHVRDYLKLIDGNKTKRKAIVDEFSKQLQEKDVVIKKSNLIKYFKMMAEWKKIPQDSSNKKTEFCWCVNDEYKKEYVI